MLPGSEVIDRESPPSQLESSDAGTWFVVGQADRGTTAEPVLVRNLQQFVNEFGGRVTPGTTLYDSLDTFFREGGTKAYVGRVVGPAAKKANVTLKDEEGKNTVKVEALSPGEWGNDLDFKVKAGEVEGSFIAEVLEDAIVVEESDELVDKAALIAYFANSSYVSLTDTGEGVDPKAETKGLTEGTDDRNNIVDSNWKTAQDLFTAGYGPGQISAPGRTTSAGHLQLEAHGQTFNRIAIKDHPDTHTVGTHTALAKASRDGETGRYGGGFTPWAIVPGVAPGTTRTVPWSAVVCGHIARLASEGKSPNIAAAGEEGVCQYVIGLSQEAWSEADRETLNDAGVNVARLHRGAFRTYGFRTTVDPTVNDTWLELTNARLNMVISSLADQIGDKFVFSEVDGRRFKLSEFNAELVAMLVPFFVAGSLYGDTFDEAATVDTGPQVNTEETIANREIRAVIAVRMSHFGEKVVIEISKVATTEAV